MHRCRNHVLVFVVAAAASGGLFVAQPAFAATQTRYVATTGSDGTSGDPNNCLDAAHPCKSVHQGVDRATAGDTVSVAAGTYVEGTIAIGKSLTLRGHGAYLPGLPQQGNIGATTMTVGGLPDPISVTLDDVFLADNQFQTALDISNATVLIEDSDLSTNGAGVVVHSGSVSITRSELGYNAQGIVVAPTVPANDPRPVGPATVVVDHSSIAGGGVINNPTGVVTIADSTLYQNDGSAVLAHGGSTTVTDSTIHSLSADADAFGDIPEAGITYTATAPTTAASGVTVRRTIIAMPAPLPDCVGAVEDGGYNLSADAGNTCRFSAAKHDLIRTDPQLGFVKNNGGPTSTLMPANSSPAIDAIPAARCSSDDQRGVTRPQGAQCDIGAVEVEQTPLVITTPNALPHARVGSRFHVQLEAKGGLGASHTFSLAPTSRRLPAGLTLSGSGLLSGTPTRAGRYRITVSVDDPTLKTFTLVIEPAANPAAPVAPVTPADSATAPIADTGADPIPLTIFGLLTVLAGLALHVGAGRVSLRPGRHRS